MRWKIEHWDKTAWAGGDPDWTMEGYTIMESLHMGGNYGRGNMFVFWESSTKDVYLVTDWDHGNFSKRKLDNLSGMDLHDLTKISDNFLKQFSEWDGITE